MTDPRLTKLCETLARHSCALKPGEKVLIENTGFQRPFVLAMVEQVRKAGALPFVWIKDDAVNRALLTGITREQAAIHAEHERALMAQMDAYVGMRAEENGFEMADVPTEDYASYERDVWAKVHGEVRVPHTKWVVLRYPLPSMAQKAGMSTEAFEDYFFDVCCVDYARMSRAMDPLVERLDKAKRVHIVGPGTDLRFSLEGMRSVKCAGECNIPDGEVYTAPVRDSVEGVLTYNTPSVERGFTFENVRLTFKNGKIVEAESNNTPLLNAILDTDEGARYVGEFALGVNPSVTMAMKDTLFDEKIAGSFHFTPGACYDECPNGNASALHWDMVCIQTKEHGGGEIWLDDELIRKDGLFVTNDLLGLNPDALR